MFRFFIVLMLLSSTTMAKWNTAHDDISCSAYTMDVRAPNVLSVLSYTAFSNNVSEFVPDNISIVVKPIKNVVKFDNNTFVMFMPGVSVKFDFGDNDVIFVDMPALYVDGEPLNDIRSVRIVLLSPSDELLKKLMEAKSVTVTLVFKSDHSVLASDRKFIFDLTGSAKSIMKAKNRCKNSN